MMMLRIMTMISSSSDLTQCIISHQTKVTNLDDTISGEVDVAGLKISVNQTLLVDIVHS